MLRIAAREQTKEKGHVHFVDNVKATEMETDFSPDSNLGRTCTNFLELVTQCLQLLLATKTSFQEPVKRKRKCVLMAVSRCRVEEAEEKLCMCLWVWNRMKERNRGEERLGDLGCDAFAEISLRGQEKVGNSDKVVQDCLTCCSK